MTDAPAMQMANANEIFSNSDCTGFYFTILYNNRNFKLWTWAVCIKSAFTTSQTLASCAVCTHSQTHHTGTIILTHECKCMCESLTLIKIIILLCELISVFLFCCCCCGCSSLKAGTMGWTLNTEHCWTANYTSTAPIYEEWAVCSHAQIALTIE